MGKTILVTGANGHLGNNLVRKIVANGKRVKAGVRNIQNRKPFEGVNCEIIHADLLDKNSLAKALKDVDTLYQVAAVYRHWAKNPEKEIIQPNLTGTKNILEAAARQKVRKVIYVSSITALDRRQTHMNETSWNQNPANPYYQSKIDSEKLALSLAKRYAFSLISVLPAAMIGPHCYGRLTPTMKILDSILSGNQNIDPSFHVNFVSIEDVVDGMITAAEKGRNGERYILGSESPVKTADIFKIAQSISLKVKSPLKPPKSMLKTMAFLMNLSSKITGKEPSLTPSMVNTYHKDNRTLDLSKSYTDLGYNPQNPLESIKTTMVYLQKWKS